MTDRLTRDAYYMGIARAVAARGTCLRRQVGAVLVVHDRIIATGYNGAPLGAPECRDAGCQMEDGHCIRTLHAEENAMLEVGGASLRAHNIQGKRHSFDIRAALYTTTAPCWRCANMILQCRIPLVVAEEPYTDPTHKADVSRGPVDFLKERGVIVRWFSPASPGT